MERRAQIRLTGQKQLFPTFTDSNTLGLWLFDETQYPYTTLTDASQYEHDLRLMEGGKLVSGKFGNALSVSPSLDAAVSYAGWKGAISIRCMRREDGIPSGLWGPTIPPEMLLSTFAEKDWTCEFWLKLASIPDYEGAILDMGYVFEPGISLKLAGSKGNFLIENAYGGFRAVCPTNIRKLGDGNWHHVAFTRRATTNQVRHFLDGQEQSATAVSPAAKEPMPAIEVPANREIECRGFDPESSPDWCKQHRFNFSVGHNRHGMKFVPGVLDELRVSDVVRYSANFTVPGSFSRNYGVSRGQPAASKGPALLFPSDASPGPVCQLGLRKHVFIDDALVETMSGVKLTMNRPTMEDTDIVVKSPAWRPAVFDRDGKVHMFIPDAYHSAKGLVHLLTSDDGLHFVYHSESPVINGTPCYGNAWQDLNPDTLPEERFKFTAWVANRGIYLHFSPDGVHWRRNETIMLPLVSGGEAETYYDNQKNCYVSFLKRDSSYHTDHCPGTGRRAVMFEARHVTAPWPFRAVEEPYFEGWPFPSVTCEGPIAFEATVQGQVYRTRAIKYPWAPDTYLAFIWRILEDTGACRNTELAVSRNGITWAMMFGDHGWYYERGSYNEVVSIYGMVRRGQEIWQYADFGACHSGLPRTWARMTQRLDGFVSLDAGDETGTIVTRPLIFKGSKLALNVAATGTVRVGLLSEAGEALSGFDVSDCDPIRSDSVDHVVTWNGNSNVDALAGRIVGVKFEMQNSKLYAFQFVGDTSKSNR